MKPGNLWFHYNNFPDGVYRFVIRLLLILQAALACSLADATPPRFIFVLEDLQHPAFNVRLAEIRLTGTSASSLEINLGELVFGGQTWRDLRLSCDHINIIRQSINCSSGMLWIAGRILTVIFRLSLERKQLVLVATPVQRKSLKEEWRLTVDWQAEKWQAVLKIVKGEGEFLAALLPQTGDWPQVHQVRIDGITRLSGYGTSISELITNLDITGLSFSDPDGLRAGDRIRLQVEVNARKNRDIWQWQSKVTWLEGEIFWQPFYFVGTGHQLTARGIIHDELVRIEQGVFNLPGMGEADFSASVSIPDGLLRQAWLSAENLELSTLFESIIRPLVVETALAEAEAVGQASIIWHYRSNQNQSLTVDLLDVSLTDARQRFLVEGLNAHIPWGSDRELKEKGVIRFDNARVLQIPLGAVNILFETSGARFSIPHAEVPVLDGKILIENFTTSLQDSGWQWQFNGQISPISMEKLTESLQVQPLFGKLSGIIPRMRYADSTMTMEGELVFDIFDGVAVVRNLSLTGLFSRVPRLTANMAMHYIDLDLLTRVYSFGNMLGRIDVEVNDLELINWEPVRFDATLGSSPGDYKRRISQAAIKNLTALGGESAITAIQKSFLGFFEQFRYSEIGWRCKLRGHVCLMGGIDPWSDDNQSYMLVKGGGIPAITITGYNREVDWRELVQRLGRAVESGNPIVH